MTDDQTPYYKVLSVEDTSSYDPQHGAVHVKRVRVRFHDGQTSYVDIPASDYVPQTVLDRIHDLAVRHEQVMSLAGPPISMQLPQSAPDVKQILGS